ncbi:amino acid ABC transporter substrate-binding protein [Lapidilactobacillus achengensis]|uniref:Amino acid ABC transporter substrate-binding protein n=1 Tax=Lapidilactobacillus achengensis TaxID=2486000 RepID=A0ABW1USQ9_9LACO|nr:amino acid ABC transporter substrate-binding protein [Lapidilactobacillus achengensis]
MRLKKEMLTLLLGMGLLFSLAGCGSLRNLKAVDQPGQTLIVGLDDTFVPMGFQEKDGSLAGFDIDLAKAVGRELDQPVTFQAIDWNMKETELKNGTIDLIWNGYTKTKERQREVAFSDPYLRNQQVLVTKTAANIRSFAAMKGKKVGLQNGSSGQTLFERQPQVLKNIVADHSAVLFENFNTAFLDLQAGRIQGIVGDSIYAGYYIRQQHNQKQYRIISGGYPEETFAVGLRKSDTKLRRRLNTALAKLSQNGTISRLSEKWFKQDLAIKIGA